MNDIIKQAEEQIWQQTGNKVSLVPVYQMTFVKIMCAAKDYYGIPMQDLNGKKRHQQYQNPRKVVIYIASKYGYSTVEIGKRLYRNHSTILHNLRIAEAWYNIYDWFQKDVEEVIKRIAYEIE